ncbi:Carboxypeptidase [Mycena chlorophos]|uniref:Carboxypeptidase n=1 Tax=Mycena chlorophos TaxID=658473 RepID=A0A8H6WJD4_MYCCL|nr:Carboxypeptidase [Mycena chlorophos]
MLPLLLGAAFVTGVAATQNWSSPAHYPGKPTTNYGPDWQSYFEVTSPLPNVTWPLPRSFAGSISTKTPGSSNNTAFFWGFEHSNGSLTAAASDANVDDPWMIWLAGGPGYSSIASALVENIGPIVVTRDGLGPNNYSWDRIADMFFVDNPVGTGYSTVGIGGYPDDEDRVAQDFLGFVSNLVKVFPSLSKRPLHLVGESYAGRFIPYILKNYFALPADSQSLIRFGKIGSSNPALSEANLFENIPILRVVETYPQLVAYDTRMLAYLREQSHLCRFDLNLTYPQKGGKLPYTRIKKGLLAHRLPQPGRRRRSVTGTTNPAEWVREFMSELHERWLAMPEAHRARSVEEREAGREAFMRELVPQVEKRGLTTASAAPTGFLPSVPGFPGFDLKLTGKINEFFGCDLRDTMLIYALNHTYPWNQLGFNFDYLDIPFTTNPISENLHPHHWMNNNVTRAALHAPNNEIWAVTIHTYPWGNNATGTDPSPPSTFFLDELAANASAANISMVWYSGNDDALTTHWSTEVVIQNTTFGGIQGFTRKPDTPWYDDSGEFSGVVRQERGMLYALLYGAGHQTPVINPARSFAFIRDFFVGGSPVGAVDAAGHVTLDGPGGTSSRGAHAAPDPEILPDGVITGQAEVWYNGRGPKTETVVWPTKSVEAWNAYVSSVFATGVPASTTASASATETSHVKSATTSTKTSTSVLKVETSPSSPTAV